MFFCLSSLLIDDGIIMIWWILGGEIFMSFPFEFDLNFERICHVLWYSFAEKELLEFIHKIRKASMGGGPRLGWLRKTIQIPLQEEEGAKTRALHILWMNPYQILLIPREESPDNLRALTSSEKHLNFPFPPNKISQNPQIKTK